MYVSCFFLFFSFFILCLKRFKTRLKRLFKTCFLLTHNPIYIYMYISYFSILERLNKLQLSLNSHGAVIKVLPHLNSHSSDVVREILCFIVCMLYAGNSAVQVN